MKEKIISILKYYHNAKNFYEDRILGVRVC